MELYINEQLVDLYPFAGVGITYQSSNIFALDTRSGNFTNKFKVPKTSNNNIIFEFSNSLNSGSDMPYQLNTSRISVNGVNVMPEGSATIEESADEYSINVFSGNYDFFNIIKTKNLNELDLSAYDHTFDRTTVQSYIEDITSGLVYPVVDFFKDRYLSYNKDIAGANRRNYLRLGSILPAFYTKTLFEAITTLTGYTFSGTFTTSTMWDKLLLTANRFQKTSLEEENKQERITSNNTFYSVSLASGTTINQPSIATTFPFNSNSSLFSYTNDILTPHRTGTYELHARLNFTIVSPTGRDTHWFFKYRECDSGGTLIGDVDFRSEDVVTIFDTGFVGNAAPVLNTESVDTEIVTAYYFETGKYYKPFIGYYVDTIGGTGSYASSVTMNIGTSFDFQDPTAIYYKDTVTASEIYDKSMYDFVKDIILFNGLNVQTNIVTKEIILDYMNDLKTNTFVDWTSKVDVSKTPSISFQLGNYGQNNLLKWAGDEFGIAQGEFTIANSLLETEVTAIQLKAPAVTETYTYLAPNTAPSTYVIPKVPIFDYEVDAAIPQDSGGTAGFYFGQWQTVDSGDCYFLVTNNQTIAASSHNVDVIGIRANAAVVNLANDLNFAYFSKAATDDSLDFENLQDLRYTVIREMFSQFKMVTLYMNLSPVDITELDTSIPIYINIKNVSGYFYLNKISGYKGKESVKCELIRL
jgi:hypothetical protein